MNDGLVAAIAQFVNPLEEDPEDQLDNLLPDFAVVACHPLHPITLDEALRGLDTQKWQEALAYKISQLEKLETWEVVDLLAGHTAILCSEVLRVKRGPDGVVQSYCIRIVAGGHRQVEGINYTETFYAVAKCQLYMSFLQMLPTRIGKLSPST